MTNTETLRNRSGPAARWTRLRVDKVASSTINLGIEEEVDLLPTQPPRVGDAVVVRTLTDNPTYNKLELTSGRLARLNPGDVMVGVLGRRRALKGFVGDVPRRLQSHDRLHVLSLGGVIGRCTGRHHEMGRPIEAELLGMAGRHGQVLNISETALPCNGDVSDSPPLIIVAGTCMNSGKTQAATEIIKQLTRRGRRVAGAKLSGVAALRDTLDMQDHGAVKTLSFLDCGLPSTVGLDDLAPLAKTIISHLCQAGPDAIVLEMGDGLLGFYEVESLFDDQALLDRCAALVFCAGDFVGAWGGLQLLRQKKIRIDVFSGSATDSQMGVEYIEREFGVAAANALRSGERLHRIVEERLEQWKAGH
ncbi:MAG TPA: hypothetical protein VLU25_12555 [Acidobacteriota bacterium]|nr:hypothetical protein [Acidobacteriota bacterium]